MTINFLQVNLGGGSAAQNLALQTALERSTDILVLSEFYKFGKAHERWHCDSSNRASIAILLNLPVDEFDTGNNGFVWVTIGDMRMYSCYWSPNTSNAEFDQYLKRLEANVRTSPVSVVIAGNFNAKHCEWSSPINNVKGEALADMVRALDLAICNHGRTPTREKDRSQSLIDVTMVSARLQHKVSG